MRPATSPGVAAALSCFICGLGQIYNRQIGKGIAMMVAYLV
jgi:TM2 domain-containing membrane protein YozV